MIDDQLIFQLRIYNVAIVYAHIKTYYYTLIDLYENRLVNTCIHNIVNILYNPYVIIRRGLVLDISIVQITLRVIV